MEMINTLLTHLVPNLLNEKSINYGDYQSCYVKKGIEFLPYSNLFNKNISMQLELLLKRSNLTFNEDGYYVLETKRKAIFQNIPINSPLWYFIRRQFNQLLDCKYYDLDKIFCELEKSFQHRFYWGYYSTNIARLFINQPPIKDVEILKIINKHRKPINLEEF